MFKRFLKIGLLFFSIGALILGADFSLIKPVEAALSLNGRILLQVQDKGQAWYVNPLNNRRYYLGRPDDAFAVMRALGLGVSSADLNSYTKKAPARLAGRILLKVQDKGQAYYVDPIELKLYYLGRPTDAFNVMRLRGLGISNRDLNTILVAPLSATATVTAPTTPLAAPVSAPASNVGTGQKFTFKYQNNNYELIQPLSAILYNSYKNSPKVYSYPVGHEPANLREEFYGLFLKVKTNDLVFDEIISKLKKQATDNKWSDDQLVEFVISFIQYIPYDKAKVSTDSAANTNPYFPYETLYLNKGVCSDKTFLGVVLLRKLGYGAAILDFPDHNHTALGVACPKEYSLNNSGYCYGETTNYFPLGVIPQNLRNGQAQTAEEFTNLFSSSNLGKTEIYQSTSGKLYQGMPALQARIEVLKNAKGELNSRQAEIQVLSTALTSADTNIKTVRSQMDIYYNNGQITEYNSLITNYNSLVNKYNADIAIYQGKINEYNTKISEFNSSVRSFYQQ